MVYSPESGARTLQRLADTCLFHWYYFGWSPLVARADPGRVAPARAVCRLARAAAAHSRYRARATRPRGRSGPLARTRRWEATRMHHPLHSRLQLRTYWHLYWYPLSYHVVPCQRPRCWNTRCARFANYSTIKSIFGCSTSLVYLVTCCPLSEMPVMSIFC